MEGIREGLLTTLNETRMAKNLENMFSPVRRQILYTFQFSTHTEANGDVYNLFVTNRFDCYKHISRNEWLYVVVVCVCCYDKLGWSEEVD